MDKAKDVIYFSMGAHIRSSDLNPDILDVILKVFASMENTLILWKFESIKLKDRHPKNVIIGPWMPQQEILAHKNLKVFITHGGFLSTMEAIYYGKPIVGIPLTNVQKVNMKRAVNQGYGIYVDIFTMTEISLQTAINAVLNDNSYQSNVTELSKLFQDNLVKPIDKAVYYVEHVIRTQGAKHFKTLAHRRNEFLLTQLMFAFMSIVLILITISQTIKFIVRKLQKPKSSKKRKLK